jgi:DNA-binding NarL/FixJ family response regulator
MSKNLRVLIADDHEQCRWLTARLLSLNVDVVGAKSDGRQLVDAAVALRPDVIVSDISMPVMTGVRAMIELKGTGYDIPFVLISSDATGVDAYLEQGAIAFVAKVDMGSELVPAVASAYSGHCYVSRSAERGPSGRPPLRLPFSLSSQSLEQLG